MSAEPSSPAIRLPVWRLVKASLASVFRHLDNFVSRVWPWVAIIAGLTAVLGLGFDMTFGEKDPATLVVSLCLSFGPIMVVVNWHRGLLLNEPGGPATAFRLDLPFWRYLVIGIMIGILVAAIVMLPSAITAGLVGALTSREIAGPVAIAMGVVLFIAVLPLSSRLLLALPMAAIDEQAPLLRRAWRLGQGNGWRLFGALLLLSVFGYLIQFVPLLAAGAAIGIAAGSSADAVLVGGTANLILQPLFAATSLLDAALFGSFASYAYAVLTGHPLGREVTG